MTSARNQNAKNYKGKVELITTGWRKPTTTLHLGGRDRTRLVGGMAKQEAAVNKALRNLNKIEVLVHSIICCTNADWPLVGGTGSIDGVWIGYAKASRTHHLRTRLAIRPKRPTGNRPRKRTSTSLSAAQVEQHA